MTNHKPRTCGFRFSWADAVAVIVCAVATWLAWPWVGSLAILMPYVLGHFFLFCNIFRIRRKAELIWAGVFLVNFAACSLLGRLEIAVPLLAQLPVTIAALVWEIRQPTYHGIVCRKLNRKNIDRYLNGEIP